ncbi:hypothetical protein [Reyranella massiliensis]|uniref:hypothetical protein n=1 Tax=Reyranella massiliensis TaxID=445220 RepID=UPI0006ACB7A4|nr:hypothetical protein [Reyranella massiliensis]
MQALRHLVLIAALLACGCKFDVSHYPITLQPPYSDLPPAPPGASIDAGKPVPLTPLQQEAIVAGVMVWLKDGSSARFGEMRAARNSHGKVTVCGLVDGRNSEGRLLGLAPFIGVIAGTPEKPDFVLVEIGSTPRQRAVVTGLCEESGIRGSG